MFLNGARLRYVDDDGEEVLVPAKGRSFQIGSYFSSDVFLEPPTERLVCEITCDAFGRVTLLNHSSKHVIHLNDKIIHGHRSHPLLHGNRITILGRVYTWESHTISGSEDVSSTPERLPRVEPEPSSCPSPSLKSHRPTIYKRLTVHNFHYSINWDEEGNTSIESRDQSESHLDEQESLNFSTPPSAEMSSCETPKVDLVEATQNKENTATPTSNHQQLLQLCAVSDVVITSFSPRETGVNVEKSFTCVRKPTKAAAGSVTMSTPKSVYSTPKGGVLSELNDDSCSRDLMDFCTPSTSKNTKRQSSMFVIDLTTPSKLRPSCNPTPNSVDSTDESSDGSPIVIDITNSATPSKPARSQLTKTPRRPVDGVAATPTRTSQSLMKRALLTSTKKKQNAANQTPVATPNRPTPRRLSQISPRLPFGSLPTPEQKEVRSEKSQTPKSIPHKRQSLHLGTPRDNKLSQIRKSLAAAKRSPAVDLGIKLKAKARRTLNSPKSSSPKAAGSSKPASPAMRTIHNVSQPKCSTPEKLDDSTKDELSRTFTVLNESGNPAEEGSLLGIMSAIVTGEMEDSVASKILDPTLPPKEIREEPSETPKTDLQSAEEKVESPNKDDSKLCENGMQSFGESCQEPENSAIQASEKVDNLIEDNICEELYANIPKELDEDAKLAKGIDVCEEESSNIKSADAAAEAEENKGPTSRVESPMIRRSLRRLSVDQKSVVATTPRRGSSTRRGSLGASSSQAGTNTESNQKGTRRASCSALVDNQEASGTPRRKRRLSEQMCTPTRQSKRLLMNTPKPTLQVDESIGDMGVIVEEDDDEKSCVEDENYGKELPCDEPDNVDYHGLRDLLRTPKNCSTPRFKGLRDMLRTPKVPASPIFGNIEELLDNSNIGSTPHHSKTSRSIIVARVAEENGQALEGVLKTPSARNIMVPNEPASAVLKSRGDSLATTTEYDLGMTNTTLHLDQIFDDVPSTSVANLEDTEAEINVTAVSTASGLDPLKESVSSEAPMSVHKLEATGHKNDPLTSTTYKTAMQADLDLSTTFSEKADATSRPSSLGSNEMSGIQLLDQTSDSMFSEPLIVSGVESCNVTVDETGALGQTTTYQELEINDIDTDSNVGLTEPLVFSEDDDEEAVTPKKSIAKEVSMAYKLEESIASKDITLNQSTGKPNVTARSVKDETTNRENDDSLTEEVSLIEVNESVAGDSINTTKDGKSLVIELDSSSDMDGEPSKEADESAAVELTIVDSEVFPLDSTQEDEVSTSVDQKPDESGSEEAGIVDQVPPQTLDSQINDPLPCEEVLEKSRSTAVTPEGKESGVSAAVEPETLLLDETEETETVVDEDLSTNNDQKPIDSECTTTKECSTVKTADEDQSINNSLAINELAEEQTVQDDVSLPVDSETLPLASTIDSEPSITKNDATGQTAEENLSVIDDLSPKELAEEKITGDDAVENDVSAVVDSEILPLEEEFTTNVCQQPNDSKLPTTTEELSGKPAEELSGKPAEDLPVIDALPSEKQTEDKITTDDAKETTAAVDSDIFPIDINPQAEHATNDDQNDDVSTPVDSETLPLDSIIDSESSITKEDSIDKIAEEVSSVSETLPSKESATDELPVDAKISDATTDDKTAESLDQDAEPNKIESISTVTKPEAGEVPKEPMLGAEPNISESPKADLEQSTLEVPLVDEVEIQKGDVKELSADGTATADGDDVEVVCQTEESVLETLTNPSPSPANIEDTDMIQEKNIKEDAAEDGIVEETKPCGDQKTNGEQSKILASEETSKQNEADKTQVESSVCQAESDENTTIDQLSMMESTPVTAADKSLLIEVDQPEESNADITASDPQERDVAAVTEIDENEAEVNVNKTDSISLETTQNESCGQKPESPKVVPPTDNMETLTEESKSEEEVNQLDKSSISEDVEEVSVVKETPEAKSYGKEDYVNQLDKSSIAEEVGDVSVVKETPEANSFGTEDDVNQLDKSSISEDVEEVSVVKETPEARPLGNDPEVVAASEEMSAQQVEFKPLEESLNEVEETSIDTSAKEASKEQTCQIIPSTTAQNSESVKDDSVTEQKEEVSAQEKCQEESITDILKSSAPLEASSTSGVEDKSVAENLDVSTTETPNSSIAVDDDISHIDGAPEASATEHEKPLIEEINEDATVTSNKSSSDSEDKPQTDESTPTDAESDGKTQDRSVTEMQPSEEAAEEIPLATPEAKVVSATDNDAKSLPETTEPLPIEEKFTEAVENQAEELTEGTSAPRTESNTYIGEQSHPDVHPINVKSPNQKIMQVSAVKASDTIVLSDDSSSESPPVEEDDSPAPVLSSEADASVPIEETQPTEDSKDIKVEDVPAEGTPIAEDCNAVKEVSDIIELSDDSSSESPPAPVPASVPIEETPPTEDTKLEYVPEEVTPIAEDRNTTNGPDSEKSSPVSIKETIPNQNQDDGKVEDISDELQNGAAATQSSELVFVEVEAAETTSTKETVGIVEQDEKSLHKSMVEGSADAASPSKEKEQSSGEVSSTVELDSEHVQNVEEASQKEASNSENIQKEKLAAPINSSMEPEPEQLDFSPEPSVSLKHSRKPSDKEELKPNKRATRKGSVSVETPAEQNALEKPSRRARKPSAEVEEMKPNDIHEKPKRRAARKASADVAEPMTHVQDKEEEVLNAIPEEAHTSRANEDNEPPIEEVTHQKQEEDVLEKPKRRARKPSEEVKSADITEKPKRRGRKPSAEVPEPMVHIEKKIEIEEEPKEEEQAQSSKINKQHEPQNETDSSQKQDDATDEEHIQNKEEIAKEPNEQSQLQKEELEELKKSEETEKSRTERPKRRGRKASAEETETTSGKKPKVDDPLEVIEEKDTPTSNQMEQEQETQKPERPKRRGRKASAQEDANNVAEEALQSIIKEDNESKAINTVDEEPEDVRPEGRSRRRGRKHSKEEVAEDTAAASQPNSENSEQPSILTEPNRPPKRTRKSSEFVPAEVHESAKETDHLDRPKRRGRKPSVDIEHVVQDVADKPRRRGRTPADSEMQPSGEAKEEEPDKRSKRTARKPSTETVDAVAVAHSIEVEHLDDIEEVAEPEPKPEPEAATSTITPLLEEEEEPKTRRRGRKLPLETLEMPAKKTADKGHSRLRGRKATEDETLKSEDPEKAETNLGEEQSTIVPADSHNDGQEQPADVLVVTGTERKTKRRVRKASANDDVGATVAKRTATRRGRKEDTHHDDNQQEKNIDLQQLPTESLPAVVVMSATICGDAAVESGDEITPRRREGRNMPHINYDETSDEDKRSARRPRKPAASKLLAFKGPEEDSTTPQAKRQPVKELETPANPEPLPEPTSSQRREGRNVPRKNYKEAPDDDKPSTSRNRRVRNLTAKALELIVDSSPRPTTPKGRKVKAAGKDELPTKRISLELAAPPIQIEAEAEEEPAPAPVIAKGRAARRKADDNLSEPLAASHSKRAVRGQREESEEQPEAKPVARSARARGGKAKADTDPDEAAVPAKKARGGSRAKTPVNPPDDNITELEEQPPTAKGRGGTRAKPAARTARARGGQAKVDTDLDEAAVPARNTRGGSRAKTPVNPPEETITELKEQPPTAKKGRGGTRAKTPVAVIPEDTAATKAEDEPAKKPTARSRARGGAKAVAVPEPEQQAPDSDVEPATSATTLASMGGRAKKVHFEATETASTAAASAEDAPKRRGASSRRK